MIGAAAFSRGGTVPDEASADVIALAIDVIDEAYWTVRRAEQAARAALYVTFFTSRRATMQATAGQLNIREDPMRYD